MCFSLGLISIPKLAQTFHDWAGLSFPYVFVLISFQPVVADNGLTLDRTSNRAVERRTVTVLSTVTGNYAAPFVRPLSAILCSAVGAVYHTVRHSLPSSHGTSPWHPIQQYRNPTKYPNSVQFSCRIGRHCV